MTVPDFGFVEILARDRYLVSIPGILCALALVLLWKSGRKQALLGLFALSLLVPIFGVMDLKNYSLSRALQDNFRYFLHWYPFGALCLAVCILRLPGKVFWEKMTAAGFALIFFVSAAYTLRYSWGTNDGRWLFETLNVIKSARAESGGGKIILDDARFAYYLPRGSVILSKDISVGGSLQQVSERLAGLGVGVITFRLDADRAGLKDFVQEDKDIYLYKTTGHMAVYVFGAHAAAERRRALETHRRSAFRAGCAAQPAGAGCGAALSSCRRLRAFSDGRLSLPPSKLSLADGSLALWARIEDDSSPYHTLISVNDGRGLYAYHTGRNGGVKVFYCGKELPLTDAVSARQWHHYVFTWRDGEQAVYVDGELSRSGAFPVCAKKAVSAALGRLDRPGAQEPWDGIFCGVSVFGRALSPQEVRALYLFGK